MDGARRWAATASRCTCITSGASSSPSSSATCAAWVTASSRSRDAAVRSIRANLVLWVVGTLGLGTVVVLGATYALTRNQVGRLFDEELKQVAHAGHLREDWPQTRRLPIALPGFALAVCPYDSTGRVCFDSPVPTLPPDLPQSFKE